jgi:glycosyltransferase involved in cell wall biosynthesis
MTKVSVYITAYNYANYVEEAVESILDQTMLEWELLIINDGSTDNTLNVIKKYESNPKIKIIDQENKGLNVTNNIALRISKGKYLMRLDADDYLDQNALLILSNILDIKPEFDLVYPDYYTIDPSGKIIEQVRRKKLNDEVKLLDLPAHGACTMFRTNVLRQIGGYIEEFDCQDGYELWLRFIKKHQPYNVNIPLFYYRQHPASLTNNKSHILETRREIKRKYIETEFNGSLPKVLGIVPATRQPVAESMNPFVAIAGKPAIWHTLSEIELTNSLDRVVLTSEDEELLEYTKDFSLVQPMKRDLKCSQSNSKLEDLVIDILIKHKQESGYEPDAVCILYVNTPLRRACHIDWAVDTLKIFNVDTVLSVQEELAHCYRHRKFGLEPINKSPRNLRLERDAIYKENGAIILSKVDKLFETKSLYGGSIGHVVMLPEESVKINSEFELWLAERVLLGQHSKT